VRAVQAAPNTGPHGQRQKITQVQGDCACLLPARTLGNSVAGSCSCLKAAESGGRGTAAGCVLEGGSRGAGSVSGKLPHYESERVHRSQWPQGGPAGGGINKVCFPALPNTALRISLGGNAQSGTEPILLSFEEAFAAYGYALAALWAWTVQSLAVMPAHKESLAPVFQAR
jgi:hypothetical protein